MMDDSLWQTAIDLQRYLEQSDQAFCFIGGIVVQRWGQPRTTIDVDATIVVPFGQESTLARKVLQRYQSRIEDPISFAIQARILLLQDIRNNPIDLSIGGLEFEHRVVQRSSFWGLEDGEQIRACSAEDLIVLKAFASREQDWVDIKSIMIRQGEALDFNLVLQELGPLADLKEEPEIIHRIESLYKDLS